MANIGIIRGDTANLDLVIRDSAGAALSLAGCTLRFTAKRSIHDPDTLAVLSYVTGAGITHTDEPGGLATVDLAADDTALVAPGTYDYDVQLTEGNGRVSTVARGTMQVLGDITRA